MPANTPQKEDNAAEAIFRYLIRAEELGDTSIRYVSTAKPMLFERGAEGAAHDTFSLPANE